MGLLFTLGTLRNNFCTATEHYFLFILDGSNFCNGAKTYPVQCEHSPKIRAAFFSQPSYNWVDDYRNTAVEDLIKSQLQSEEEFADQRSSYFKLCIAINFNSLGKKFFPSLDLPFDTVMTTFKLFHVIDKKCTMFDKLSR